MINIYKTQLRLAQLKTFLSKTKTPVPLVLDLLKIQKNPYIAETDQGYKALIRPKTGERFGFFENLLRMDYITNKTKISPGDTVVDIGANIGCFTIFASSQVGSSGRVIAIEPDKLTFEQLLKNIELNKLTNVTPINMAISDKNELIALNVCSNSQYASIYDQVDSRQMKDKTITVESKTLEKLTREFNINEVNFLKLDCEGAEYGILDSLTPEFASRIAKLSMEVHKVPGRDAQEIKTRLTDLGFQVAGGYPLLAWR